MMKDKIQELKPTRIFKLTNRKIILTIILFIPFLLSYLLNLNSNNLLYLYFPIIIINVFIAFGLDKIGIIYNGDGFRILWLLFIFITTALYTYLMSCIILFFYNKWWKK